MTQVSSNDKRIAKNTLFLYIRMLLIMTVTLYTSRIILQTLGIEDYGIYNVVGGVVTMFTFVSHAISGATQRFFSFELGKKDYGKLHEVFCTSLNIHFIIAMAILVLAETIGLWFMNNYLIIPESRLSAAHWVFQSAVFSTMLLVLSAPYNAAIIAHEKMSAFAYISILEVLLRLGIVYILTIIPVDKLKLYALLIVIIQFIIRCIYGFYCKKNFYECKYRFNYNATLFKEMFFFAGWSLFGNLAAVAFSQGVNILLNMFFGPVVNAARAVAVQVQQAIQGFIMNFQTALNPQITKNYAVGEFNQMHRLVFASGRYSFFLLFFLALPIAIEINPILTFWLGTVPEYTAGFIRLTLCVMMVDTLSNPLITAAQATGRIRVYQTVVGSLLLLIVPISYMALKLGGQPEIVFIVHFLMVAVAQIARLIMIRPMIHLSLRKYFKEVVVKIAYVVLSAIILPVAVYLLLPQNTLYSFLSVCGVCVISVSVSVYYLGLGKGEQAFVIEKIEGFKQKIFNR